MVKCLKQGVGIAYTCSSVSSQRGPQPWVWFYAVANQFSCLLVMDVMLSKSKKIIFS